MEAILLALFPMFLLGVSGLYFTQSKMCHTVRHTESSFAVMKHRMSPLLSLNFTLWKTLKLTLQAGLTGAALVACW